MREASNEALSAAYRTLLTAGLYGVDVDGVILEDTDHAALLATTKPWRRDLWRHFQALEDRLCPVKARNEGRAP